MLDAIVGREPRPPQRTGPLQAVLDVLLVKDPADRADEAAVRPLLLAAAGPDAPPEPERLPDLAPSANGAAANLSTSTATNGAEPAANGAEPAANGSDPAATSAIATLVTGPPRREPWFFDIPVETVPPPPRSEPAPAVERHPWPDQTRRLPKGFWIAVLAAGIGAVLIALVTTNGRILSPDRPSQEDAEGPSDPSEWVTYTDGATGFSIRHPREWGVRRSGSVTDFVDPERPGTYLRVDHVQPPAASPVEAWRSQERSISARYANYRRLQLEPTTFQDHPAAVWEFTYTDSGVELHALDLGFVTDRYGFAVNFQTRAADWSRLAPVFEAFKAGFRPPA
jgi:hypothetical protein